MDIIIHDMTIDEFAEYDHEGIGYLIGTGRVDVMDEQPTIDAVPVVRCKDCKHYVKSDVEHPDCDFCKRLICGTIRPDFFCADGEQRDTEQTAPTGFMSDWAREIEKQLGKLNIRKNSSGE